MERLLSQGLYKTRRKDTDWPYDGDLLFLETLTQQRLYSSYGVQNLDQQPLKDARRVLQELYKRLDDKPSPYYAVVTLDGDSMGERISACLDESDPRQAHRELSAKVASFATRVPSLVEAHRGTRIYSGGDDVLALAPLSTAFELARDLADTFKSTADGSASAGLAIVHHLYPLGAALRSARTAEQQAKQITKKAAVCVHVLRRSGAAAVMRSPWSATGDSFAEVARLFREDGMGSAVSSRLAYDVRRAAYALPEADAKSKAELTRLVKRHRNTIHPGVPSIESFSERLYKWAQDLPCGMEELGQWLLFARFAAQGGRE